MLKGVAKQNEKDPDRVIKIDKRSIVGISKRGVDQAKGEEKN